MRKIVSAFIFVLAFSLVGCVSVPKEPAKFVEFEHSSKFVKNGTIYTKTDMASGVQWNKDYVVTAKHVSFADGIVYKSGGELDLQFVKKAVDNVIVPKWRDRKAGENVTIIGVSQSGKVKEAKGKDLDIYSEKGNSINYLTTAVTVGGQSGGPVFSDDGHVIGILVAITDGKDANGNLDPSLKGKGKEFSLYIPYEVIQKEWNKYQKG